MSATTIDRPPASNFAVNGSVQVDPFRRGWKTVASATNGVRTGERIPLTDWDILHPEDGVTIVQTPNHGKNAASLFEAIRRYFQNRDDLLVTYDQRIDWQIEGLPPHVPDLAIFGGLTARPDEFAGTFPVRSHNASPLLVIEITSPSTWRIDLNQKIEDYAKAQVPFYLIVDHLREEDGHLTLHLFGYRLTPEGYVLIRTDPDKGVWIPSVKLWFRIDGLRCLCFDEQGMSIDQSEKKSLQFLAEKARADALARELAELKAKMTPP